ncbi:hypothetical protein Maq22A_c25580 [Methylobacterium aquaticum]|uniref:Uncharacterized protein n=1 Tax=Methylobacterium aquaticum TaxID=270351 RepID=A0A0C6FRG8_9HYPH|nr:hypothetical protein Maq22A_c25580 [Methylobacterium aquaticum]
MARNVPATERFSGSATDSRFSPGLRLEMDMARLLLQRVEVEGVQHRGLPHERPGGTIVVPAGPGSAARAP